MTVRTAAGVPMEASVFCGYIRSLVDRFFKILPIRESGEKSLETYMRSLQTELLGCKAFIEAINEDPQFVSLLGILQYLIDNPECSVRTVKREVFRAISICNKLQTRFAEEMVTEAGAVK